MSRAVRDLEEITAWVAKEDPEAAERFGSKLIKDALSLAKFPEMGRIVPEFADPTIREMIHGRYRIVYRLKKTLNRIHILRFWHASRGTPLF